MNRKKGCFFGLAIGDALGAPIEFRKPGTFTPITEYRAGGPHSLDAGAWTDDTSMALALADSLCNGFDPKDQLDKYVEWYQEGKYSVNHWCFDIGTTTAQALDNYMRDNQPDFCGITYDDASGNGSIMRLAPIPIKYSDYFPDRLEELMELGADSSVTTHASQKCLSACSFMTVFIAGLLNGVDRSELLDKKYYPSWLHPKIAQFLDGDFKTKEPPVIRGTGYVVDSLEAALWAFYKGSSFEEAVLLAVNLGDDADSTGAVCGQLAGAYWGYDAIPEKSRNGLVKSDYIEMIFNQLVEAK